MAYRCGIIGCPNEGWRSIEVEIDDGFRSALRDLVSFAPEKLLLCMDHFKLIRGSLDRVARTPR